MGKFWFFLKNGIFCNLFATFLQPFCTRLKWLYLNVDGIISFFAYFGVLFIFVICKKCHILLPICSLFAPFLFQFDSALCSVGKCFWFLGLCSYFLFQSPWLRLLMWWYYYYSVIFSGQTATVLWPKGYSVLVGWNPPYGLTFAKAHLGWHDLIFIIAVCIADITIIAGIGAAMWLQFVVVWL